MVVSTSSEHEAGQGESKGLRLFIAISLSVHLSGFVLSYFNLLKLPKPQLEEWSIDTELVTDFDVGSSPKTVIPRAQISEEVSVPSNQLPQLTKTMSVKEKAKEEEGVAEEKKEDKVEPGKNVTEDADDDGQTLVRPDAAVKLKKSEALERLVREKLKEEQKKETRELKAQANSELAQIRDILKDAGVTQSSGGLSGVAERNRYQAYLAGTIKRNYALPKTYQLTHPDLQAQVQIAISARGELMDVEIAASSGDSVFDDACVTTVQRSSPFNPPPDFLAGEPIKIVCKP